jgi:hypothetical protein
VPAPPLLLAKPFVKVGLASFAFGLLWIGLLLAGGRQPIDLMFPGDESRMAPLVAEDFGDEVLLEDSTGYDGAVFWGIAREFPDLDSAAGYMAEPRYRFQRILTPALASVGGAGNGVAIALLAVGALGGALGGGAIADIAARHGRTPWIGILFTFPLIMAIAGGLSEPMAFGLGMVGVALCDRRRLGWAAVAFTLGALAREPVALMALASGLGLLVSRQVRVRDLWPLALPSLVVVGWMAYLASRFPPSPSTDRLDPFGFLDAGPTGQLLAVLTIGAALLTLWLWRDVPAVWPLGLLFTALALSYGGPLFRFQVVYRASAPVFALAVGGAVALLLKASADREARKAADTAPPGADDEDDCHKASVPSPA